MLPPDAQAELVAKFIDAELRSGGKGGKSDDELEATLEKALMLFRYIQARAALAARSALSHVFSPPGWFADEQHKAHGASGGSHARRKPLIHSEWASDKCVTYKPLRPDAFVN